VLLGGLEFGDASGQVEIAAFEEGLKKLGWTAGQNIDLDYHWPGAQTARVRAVADEIVASHPDLVLSRSTPATAALMHVSLPTVATITEHGRHADGGGLYLSISPNGGRRWVFLFRWHGKPTEMGPIRSPAGLSSGDRRCGNESSRTGGWTLAARTADRIAHN
jgi:hypothetical protein